MKIWAKFLVEDRLSFRTVTKTNSKNINFREMSNQAWLEAYEAQKAKRLESLKANKDPFSLSGLSKESKNQKPKEPNRSSRNPNYRHQNQRQIRGQESVQ